VDYEAMLDWLCEHRDDCHAESAYSADRSEPEEIVNQWKDRAKMVNQIIEVVRAHRDSK